MTNDMRTYMQRHFITPEILELRFKRPASIVQAWIDGTRSPPPYIYLAMEALTKGADAATDKDMRKFAGEIGADPANVKYWHTTGQYPLIARYAVGCKLYRHPVREYDKEALFNMVQYRYSFIGERCVARPVMGKVLPSYGKDVSRRLLASGLIRNSFNKVIVTAAGKGYLDKWLG